MDILKTITEREKSYPDKNIIFNDKENPTEVVCEIDPTELHTDYSIAIAVIEKSKPHYHKVTTEYYEIIRGNLDLFVNDKKFPLKPGEKMMINPGEIHYGIGHKTWVKVASYPGWRLNDQFVK